MPKTKEMQVGDKTFIIREKPSYQIMDLIAREFRKIEKIEDENEKESASLDLRTKILQKMVIKPVIDDKYLNDEADMDDWNYSFVLMGELFTAIKDRTEDLKKKLTSLSGSQPEVPEKT